ncbi:MAG: IS110 family transposase, partial [Propionibacteriaceae bacterium]|nr:IS110 family transposase [Propionibacteriaceae bacterium]
MESGTAGGVDVFAGLDAGKQDHHATALDASGDKPLDQRLPNDEAKLRAVLGQLAGHGRVLLVVDQPAAIGALPVAVGLDAGCEAAYLPGLATRRAADLLPGEAKTGAKDAQVIAETARTMPSTLRSADLADEQAAETSMLCGFDQDRAAQTTATPNRARGVLTQIHPALERVPGPRLDH